MPRDLRVLLSGQCLSWLGDYFQIVALPVAVAASGGTATQLATVTAVQQITRLAFVLLGGVAADRLSARWQMIASDLVRLVSAAGMAWLFWAGEWTTLRLTLLAGVSAIASAFFMPASQVVRTALTPPEDRQRVNGLITTIRTAIGVIAPVVAGAVIGFTSPAVGFAVNAVTYAATLVVVLLLRRTPETERPGHSSVLEDLREGVRAVRERRWLVAGLLSATAFHVANGVLLVLMPLVVVQDLGGAKALGLVSGAEAVGGFVGAAIAMRHRVRRPLRAGYVALTLMALWPLAIVWPHTLPAVMLTSALGYGGVMYFETHWSTAVQTVPAHLLGRVTSVDMVVSFVMLPLGTALSPFVTDHLGQSRTAAICAVWLLAASLAPLAFRGVTDPESTPA